MAASLPNDDLRLGLLQGTLDLLILRTLASGARHGWAVSEHIQQVSCGRLRVSQGSLYPALHRLEGRGWVRARWERSELGRRARVYELTARGRRQLEQEAGAWEQFAAAVRAVMEGAS
ncbi:MAG: PadR family transcriptional regulator [Terriglobales bacterium]